MINKNINKIDFVTYNNASNHIIMLCEEHFSITKRRDF
jgi:hypothetical protein